MASLRVLSRSERASSSDPQSRKLNFFSPASPIRGPPVFFRRLDSINTPFGYLDGAVLRIESGFFRCLVWLSIFLESRLLSAPMWSDLNYANKQDVKAACLARDLLQNSGFSEHRDVFSRRRIWHLRWRFS